ncbi:helicase-exonuclease AddAB subunit AddA [Streptococcus moroccensis]|uniref:ATP-dependent helicase/nuclease subunit A n=1 Tax=Streptococcus moroccensis TaxID=1451356 RepID=A0ABT9YSB5_9STRE|nr:helicase-exonuclease AddAB subunit AddA [Streptococcus moroccensis]MDQ0222501.1 ATP-dependent helicase/nuclease subunit A [Streptococcus moroccensis]
MGFEPFLSPVEIEALQLAEAQSDKVQKRTAEQIEAIYTHGNNVLVSASAGSGKTFVMVERIIDKIKRGVKVNELFISTFTVKAAGELKERLEKKLSAEIGQTTDPDLLQHLSAQLADVQTADIGTMDAFTQKLVNQYGYLIGIAPQFRILTDKSEQDLLKQEVFSQLFETYYQGEDRVVFSRLVQNFSGSSKSTKAFQAIVDKVYSFTQSTADPAGWLQETFLKGYEDFQTEADLPAYVKDNLVNKMRQAAQNLEDLTNLPDYKQVTAKGTPTATYQKHEIIFTQLYEWSAAPDVFPSLSDLAQAVKAVIPAGDDVTVSKVKYPIFKALHADLIDLQHLTTILAYQGQALPMLRCLRDFVADFSAAYLERKIQEGTFEFSDISHFAIRILREFGEVRDLYQARYHEVMVDEYQDNNHTQEAMLDLLSNGSNRFMVGDIKQSIYRFRQADPQIFNQKFKLYQDNPADGKLILLKENFRSQGEVLDSTNGLFSHLMDEEVGDIRYDGTHMLVAGSDRQKVANPDHVTELLIYDTDSEEESLLSESDTDETDFGLGLNEVNLVIKEIIRLHNEEQVAFEDITLLVPSRTRNNGILAAFAQHGIPLVADGGEQHYLKSLEVQVMLDTLRVINNPLNDYALVALLRSPMFGFNEDELARLALQIREGQQAANLYEKLQATLAKRGEAQDLIRPSLLAKLQGFDDTLQSWRQAARLRSLHDLIWQIYNDKFYYDYVGALVNGEQRQANLYALALRADSYERTGFKGLSRFVTMIDKVLASDNDLADVPVSLPKNAVQLMTIHKSKGLEFKYVFLLNMDKSFFSNRREQASPLLISRDKGVGIKLIADMKDQFGDATKLPRVRVSMDTLPYQVNRREERINALSESMRLLYVAMTRAETKLYLVSKGSQEKLANLYDSKSDRGFLPVATRESLESFQAWFLAVQEAFGAKDNLHYKVRYVGADELTAAAIGRLTQAQAITPDQMADNRQSTDIAAMLDQLEAVDKLNQRYQAAITLPSVRTPSQIKAFYKPVLDEEGLDIMEELTADKDLELAFDLPTFGTDAPVTGATVGSALHGFMQQVPLDKPVSLADLEGLADQLRLPEAIRARLDFQKILDFLETDLGQLLKMHAAQVKREAPFAMLVKDSASQEDFVVRGIVDGYLVLDDRIVLFDYKTDRYQQSQVVIERYRDQMALYGQALSRAYGISQVDKYLVLLGGAKLEVATVKS